MACCGGCIFLNRSNTKEVVIESSCKKTTEVPYSSNTRTIESAPTIVGNELRIYCGGTGGTLNSINISGTSSFGVPYAAKKGSVFINIPSYNCGSNKTHIKKGYRDYKIAYVIVTKLYEKTYESGNKECPADTYISWSSVLIDSTSCVYE